MNRSWWKKAPKKANTPARGSADRGWRRPLVLEPLEDRLAPAGELVYHAADHTPVTLRLDGDELRIVNTTNPSTVLASSPLADVTGVRVEGAGFNVAFTLDASVTEVTGGITFNGGAGTNTLVGPATDTAWQITGPGAGDLISPTALHFTGVENLVGSTADDNFKIVTGGSIAGTIDGGAGNDALVGADVANTWTLTGTDVGTVNGQSFVRVENLIGGKHDDRFLLGASGRVTGSIEGGIDDDAAAGHADGDDGHRPGPGGRRRLWDDGGGRGTPVGRRRRLHRAEHGRAHDAQPGRRQRHGHGDQHRPRPVGENRCQRRRRSRRPFAGGDQGAGDGQR